MFESPRESYLCPVCGYGGLRQPPDIVRDWDPTISYGSNETCPSCGFEFGVTDFVTTRKMYRLEWITAGCKWYRSTEAPPPGWDAVTQLAGLIIKPVPTVTSADAKEAFDAALERVSGPYATVRTVDDLSEDVVPSHDPWDKLWGEREKLGIDDAFGIVVKYAHRLLDPDDDREARLLNDAADAVGIEMKGGDLWREWNRARELRERFH